MIYLHVHKLRMTSAHATRKCERRGEHESDAEMINKVILLKFICGIELWLTGVGGGTAHI